MSDLVLHRISKSFAGTVALNEADLSCDSGEVHGLVGQNGAGKSTLVKILSGAVTRDSGSITLFGQLLNVTGPRAAAKAGIGACYTQTGVDTYLARGKETREINGKFYVLEYHIEAGFAFIWAYKADRYGNLVYKGTSRTFNASMAGAAKITIAEVAEVVELGQLDPEVIVTPAAYVNRVVTR